MDITFLINTAYGIGGAIRSVANLSGALAARGHQVTVASRIQTRKRLNLPFDHRVTVLPLTGYREATPEEADARLAAYLREVDTDVVIATRPSLVDDLARHGNPDRYLRVGQEHQSYLTQGARAQEIHRAAMGVLDAWVTVSKADADVYREVRPEGSACRVLCIPNTSLPARVTPSTGDNRIIVAAGRLVPVKRYDLLVDAFALIAPEFPDWELRIYGRGTVHGALRERIEHHGLSGQARLMGPTSPIETEWAKGSIAAVTSDAESFGLTIVEAMACGIPVIARDCRYGPREIITPGEDGLLVPMEGGPEAYAESLRALMKDDSRRRRMGARGLRKALAYEPDPIAQRYEKLFTSLWSKRTRQAAASRSLVSRLRSRMGRPATATPTAAPLPAAGKAAKPARRPANLARTVSDSDGTVTISLPGGSRPAEGLLLRLRNDPQEREISVPLTAEGTTLTARIDPAERPLPEGRWDVFLPPKGKRVLAEVVERAALVHSRPRVTEDGVSAWLPYPTKYGNLTLRTWLRPVHAEVERVETGPDTASVTVTVLGLTDCKPGELTAVAAGRPFVPKPAAPETAASDTPADPDTPADDSSPALDDPALDAAAFDLPDPAGESAHDAPAEDTATAGGTPSAEILADDIEVAVSVLDAPGHDGPAMGADGTEPPGRLKLCFPLTGLPAAGAWTVRLLTPDGTAVPVGRIGGDVPDRAPTDVYPLAGRDGGLRLGFSSDNELIAVRQ
ncbi:glycosyltransferase [Streptomyces sp. RFCAC02]|uniref:glycosyltransferase n=1 Tax=Streptomyces sp. RFCAC02 TaxID=2499143 RepID=UPI00101F5F30|nr:glycosyltransferase [Streptomyces sp. RFCAC02]